MTLGKKRLSTAALYDSYFVVCTCTFINTVLCYIWVAEWMNFSNYSYRRNCNCCWMIGFPTACHFYFRDDYLFYFTAAISSSRSACYDLVFLRIIHMASYSLIKFLQISQVLCIYLTNWHTSRVQYTLYEYECSGLPAQRSWSATRHRPKSALLCRQSSR